jgi:hypothetical protein
MVGADVDNGIWAIYGARQGTYLTMCTDWDIVNTRDFEYLNAMWKEQEALWNQNTVVHEIERLGEILINEIGIPIGVQHLTASQSSFFKTVYRNPDRGVENFLAKKT